jgi:hypothetical protein
MRKLLHPLDYPIESNPDLNVSMGHIRHCVGAIRQPLMCSADVSVGVWQWSDRLNRIAARDDVVHTCRDFDKIRDWAKDPLHFLPPEDFEEQDLYIHIEDDLEVQGHHRHHD